jgi:oxalate decarboxylase/phosphoglucose isomerase-like protein (cupin superfamily)
VDFGKSTYLNKVYPYDLWMESVGIPIHRGYFVSDLRTVELGWWEERQCKAAFIQLMGQEGVSEGRVQEIPAGKSLPPTRFALDEVVYVLEGRGLTTVSAGEGGPKRTFEWQKHSLFLLPQNHIRQFSNMQGDKPARLLHYNYLPIAFSVVQDPEFLLASQYSAPHAFNLGGDFYSEAKIAPDGYTDMSGRRRNIWSGNFFPDMRAWDKLDTHATRGAGGHSVHIQFPGSQMSCHMSVFPAQTYKKAHRHGPGRVIVIPAGEGYSIMWQEGKEKVVVPWQEAAVFVPPEKWFHQHFNTGAIPARYLALHPLKQFFGHAEKVEDRQKDQIEYVQEDPWIRAKFEEELGKKGITSLMPDEAYRNPNYEWQYGQTAVAV